MEILYFRIESIFKTWRACKGLDDSQHPHIQISEEKKKEEKKFYRGML